MPSIEDVIEATLKANSFELWFSIWRPIVEKKIAGKLATMFDLDNGQPTSSWQQLDDPVVRSRLFSITPELKKECLDLLVAETPHFNKALKLAGHTRRSAGQMRKHLAIVLPAVLSWPSTNAVIVDNPFPNSWSALANILAAKASAALDEMIARGLGSADRDDPECSELKPHVLGLLSSYFLSCKLPEARIAQLDLEKFSKKLLPPRGSLVRIVQNVSSEGVEDKPISSSLRKSGLKLHHEYLSELLEATAEESRHVAISDGFMHRSLPRSPNDDPRLREGQLVSFPQYENTVLAYLALSCIEQLLRAWATHENVLTMSKGKPVSVLDILGQLSCAPATVLQVKELYDSSRSNIRNRIMHGGLLDVISKHQELLLHIADPSRYPIRPGWRREEFSPENICRLCLDCLEQVDADAASRVVLAKQHLSWAGSMRPSSSDLVFCSHLPNEFLGPNGRDAWARVSNYLNAVVPSVKQFVTIGFRASLAAKASDTIVQFVAMMMVFEALYRSTAQLCGFRVLQIAPGHMQYRMLDELQLCAEPILNRLVDNVLVYERANAKRALELAKRTRNAFSHGAMEELDPNAKQSIGRVLMKCVQTLVDAGIHEMTSEAAFYLWKNARKGQHGFDTEDWLKAENEVLNRIDLSAAM
jgi:hypothetical protein